MEKKRQNQLSFILVTISLQANRKMAITWPYYVAPINLKSMPFWSSHVCNSDGIKIIMCNKIAASYGYYADRKEVAWLYHFMWSEFFYTQKWFYTKKSLFHKLPFNV